jgi:hypothetical protein
MSKSCEFFNVFPIFAIYNFSPYTAGLLFPVFEIFSFWEVYLQGYYLMQFFNPF